MQNEKIDNLLNIALSLSEEERQEFDELNTGFDEETDRWEVVVRYNGSLEQLKESDIDVTYLYGGYAVLLIPGNNIEQVAALPQIEYMEMPKQLFFEVANGKRESCFSEIQSRNYIREGNVGEGRLTFGGLTGKGTIVAVIDGGFDYMHPDFRNEDGTSRILFLWDQSKEGMPPEGYYLGTEYTNEQINAGIPGRDPNGHGTHVLGIAAGNGRASDGAQAGCAPEADIICVKLGRQRKNAFPMTTELMQAVNYVIEKAIQLNEPVAINISYGNNYGAHDGETLLETYLEQMAAVWKNVIVIGSGNEGAKARHISGQLTPGAYADNDIQRAELLIYRYTQGFSIQIWKNYADTFDITLVAPDGVQKVNITENEKPGENIFEYEIGDATILVYYGKPLPYTINQEVYIEMKPKNDYFENGVWQIQFIPRNIVDGRYDMWLPAGAILDNGTGFLRATPDVSLTIPSTVNKAITVGAYDGATDSVAPFSGRGYALSGAIKPDIVAPGVNILSASPGGGYAFRSGTSMATPFVTGAASCMMQWGIAEGNDPYLYGEKLKAYLIKGARKLPGYEKWPNPVAGWGALCVEESLPRG